MKKAYDIVIIGGGILGLSLAYELALRGKKRILVIEQNYLGSGATGRCGGGFRHQFSSEDFILAMIESVRFYKSFATTFGINSWIRQGGYLFLARNPNQVDVFLKNIEIQNSLGIPTRLVDKEYLTKIVPELDPRPFLAGSYNPTDGVIFPWPVIWGLAEQIGKMGVTVLPTAKVLDFKTKPGRIKAVISTKGEFEADIIVNAAGAWSPQVARLVGIELPNKPYRHQIIVSEPLKPFLEPMVVDFSNGLYASQSMRGEIVSGITEPHEKPSSDYSMVTTFSFIQFFSRALIAVLPITAEVKLLRHWSGFYDVTPDTKPILGPALPYENFHQLNGFMGFGFMMAPSFARQMAVYILRGEESTLIRSCRFERFKTGQLKRESFVIG